MGQSALPPPRALPDRAMADHAVRAFVGAFASLRIDDAAIEGLAELEHLRLVELEVEQHQNLSRLLVGGALVESGVEQLGHRCVRRPLGIESHELVYGVYTAAANA